MMTNLFSTFDPTSSKMLSLNWTIILIILLMMPSHFFYTSNPYFLSFKLLMNYMKMEFENIMSKSLVDGSMNFIISILILILLSNSVGLFPFIFTTTSHMMLTLLLSLSIWWTFLLFRLLYQLKNFFSHLVPTGTPNALMIFMVLIESVSLIIRPITLSIRLSANMIAGHLLMTLLGSSFFLFDMNFYLLLYISQFFLLILEMAVAIIQSYVFTMLMILYSMEI